MSRVFVRLREAKGVQVNLVCVSEEAENLGKKNASGGGFVFHERNRRTQVRNFCSAAESICSFW